MYLKGMFVNRTLSRLATFITALVLLNGCASNPDACQRVQDRHKTIRQQRADRRTEKFLTNFAKFRDRIKTDYEKEITVLEDPFNSASAKEQEIAKLARIKMDSSKMGFWESFHPVNDTLTEYPLERYVYWINAEVIKAQRYKKRFIKRGLDTFEVDKTVRQLEDIQDMLIGSDAYQEEKQRRHELEQRQYETEIIAKAIKEQKPAKQIIATDSVFIDNSIS